jgi:hypothetical protein
MVAGRDEIDAGGEHVVGGLFGEPEPAGGVLPVGDYRIDVVLLAGEAEVLGEDLAARRTDDVADDQNGERGWRYDLARAFVLFE